MVVVIVIIWEESADNVMFYIGGRNMLRLHEGNGEVVVNDSQLNTDFRVEGDGRDKMLFVDASADIVAINGSGVDEADLILPKVHQVVILLLCV